jgi:hypothetical protein
MSFMLSETLPQPNLAAYDRYLYGKDHDMSKKSFSKLNLSRRWPFWIVLLAAVLIREKARLLPTMAGVILGFARIIVARGPAELLRVP